MLKRPNTYSATDRQLHRLKLIAARGDAEGLIAEKFEMPWPSDGSTTGIFVGGTPAHLRDYEDQLEREELEREQVEPSPSLWWRLWQLIRR